MDWNDDDSPENNVGATECGPEAKSSSLYDGIISTEDV